MRVCGNGSVMLVTEATTANSETFGSLLPVGHSANSLSEAQTDPGRPLRSSTFNFRGVVEMLQSATEPSPLNGSGFGPETVNTSSGFSGRDAEPSSGAKVSEVTPSATAIFW